MTTSNRLGITELAETQNNRSVTINEAIAKLEAGATFFAAVQVLLNTPPGSPAEGDLYVVGTAGTGAWSGKNKYVTVYYDAAWLFFAPFEGMFAWDQTSNSLKRYDGSAWVAFTVGAGGIADADYGDITVSGSGTVWTIDNDVVTYAKMQNVSATDKVLGRSTAGSGDVEEITFTSTARSLVDDTSTSAMRTTLGLAIGTDVQAYDAATLKSNATANLTVGYTASGYSAGTKSSGTFTPDPANGNLQYYTNGGAHTLAPPSTGGGDACQVTIQMTNNGSAGAITTSGFTKVTGSSLTTTNGDDFMLYITVLNGFSVLNVVALQ